MTRARFTHGVCVHRTGGGAGPVDSRYARPPLAWIKRRARRLQTHYGVPRRLAIFDAWRDYIDFAIGRPVGLVATPGGRP